MRSGEAAMRRILALCSIVILGLATSASADPVESFRCKSKLVQIKSNKLDVLNSCGDPERKDRSYDRLGDLDTWTYNMGAGDFVYVLQFRHDRITAIDQGSRGRFDPKKNVLAQAECKIVISDWAKVDGLTFTCIKGVVKNKSGSSGKKVQVEVKALDRQNKLVDLEKRTVSAGSFPPGKEASFEILVRNNPDISSFVPTVTWEPDL